MERRHTARELGRARPPRGSRWPGLALIGSLGLLMGIDRGCVVEPTADTIVTTGSVKVSGTISEFDADGSLINTHDGRVRLRVNGTDLATVNTVSKVWTYTNVTLANGVNRITGTTWRTDATGATVTGTIPEFLIERKTDLSDRGDQPVYLGMDWTDSGVDDMLRNIARHTLEPDPSAADLDFFVTEVKRRVQAFVTSAYSGKKITVVASPGPDVHVIRFHGLSMDVCGLYGQSPADYRNQTKAQVSEIYIRAFECRIVDNNDLLTETPALTTDTLAQRITDVATFIGRTAAHEFGHSLGLVAEGDTRLHGCDGWHNCAAYDAANASDRFDDGHYIMDPGPTSTLHARIGQASATQRGAQPPRFNAYNNSYLAIIH